MGSDPITERNYIMTLISYLHSQFSLMQYIDFCVRIIVSAIAGAMIGYERSHRFKEAGIRTHIIVCVTTALVMIISKYGFADLTAPDGSSFSGIRGADPARVAAQAVSGISFLCAGVIFKTGSNVRGLTTAAGLWLTAALGLCFGAGMYVIGGFALILMCILQVTVHGFLKGMDAYYDNEVHFKVKEDSETFHKDLTKQIDEWDAKIVESEICVNEDGTTEYNLYIRRKSKFGYNDLKDFAKGRTDLISYRSNLQYNHIK